MTGRKIIDYKLISLGDDRENEIADSVLYAIQQGWQPFGGACAYNSINNNNHLWQAMVKYEE